MSLPIISTEDLSNPRKCLVTRNNRVYDVTQFLHDHPGGPDVLTSHRGKDVSSIMADELSHDHSEAAYEMLEEYLVGVLSTPKPPSLADSESTLTDDPKDIYATGMTCEEDLNVPTEIASDYEKHKFLDLGRPLLPQVFSRGFTKEFYLAQVHRPRHYPFGSAPLMPYAWMEPLSKTPWWIVPLAWIPWVTYGTYLASQGLSAPYSSVL
jgi:4-hydroxysphinganine ceramide fatty acyl 2-hydroxylase